MMFDAYHNNDPLHVNFFPNMIGEGFNTKDCQEEFGEHGDDHSECATTLWLMSTHLDDYDSHSEEFYSGTGESYGDPSYDDIIDDYYNR